MFSFITLSLYLITVTRPFFFEYFRLKFVQAHTYSHNDFGNCNVVLQLAQITNSCMHAGVESINSKLPCTNNYIFIDIDQLLTKFPWTLAVSRPTFVQFNCLGFTVYLFKFFHEKAAFCLNSIAVLVTFFIVYLTVTFVCHPRQMSIVSKMIMHNMMLKVDLFNLLTFD